MKTPPNNPYAEASVLGSCLMDAAHRDTVLAGAIDEAVSELGTDVTLWYAERHRAIWQTVTALHATGEPVDLVRLAEKLRADGLEDRAGGVGYLWELQSRANRGAVVAHCRAIKRAAQARSLLALAQRVQEDAYTTDDPAGLLATTSAEIDRLTDQGQSGTLHGAQDWVDALFDDLRTTTDDEPEQGATTGLVDMDSQYGRLQPGRLYLIAARPGIGKTALALDVALATGKEELARGGKKPVLLFSLEMDAKELGWRLLAKEARVDVDRLATRHRRGEIRDWKSVGTARSVLRSLALEIDDCPGQTPARILAASRALARQRGGLALVVVDYVQLLQLDPGVQRNEGLGEASRTLKLMARELRCPVIGVAQLNRECESRKDKRPLLSDLFGSGSLEMDADSVWMIYRDDTDRDLRGGAEILVRKNRQGQTGTVKVAWHGGQTRFASLARGYDNE